MLRFRLFFLPNTPVSQRVSICPLNVCSRSTMRAT
jgi:hypothetical protein